MPEAAQMFVVSITAPDGKAVSFATGIHPIAWSNYRDILAVYFREAGKALLKSKD